MIVYQSTKAEFLDDSFRRDIEVVITESFARRTGGTVSANEIRAWKASLHQMAIALNDEEIPHDSGVAIEYKIPQTSKRVDFILTGMGADRTPNVIIVELKQWSEAQRRAYVSSERSEGSLRLAPSYGARSYTLLLRGFNEAVYDGGLDIEKAPLFLKGEAERIKLRGRREGSGSRSEPPH